MKCEDVESAMIDYLDNTLEKARRDEVEKHLETCERCLDELKDFQQILQTVDSTEMEQPDETLRINFYHMLHGEMNKQALQNQEHPVMPLSVRRSYPWMKISSSHCPSYGRHLYRSDNSFCSKPSAGSRTGGQPEN